MEKLATDIYTFKNLIGDGFTYVDKTDRLWPLVNLSIGRQFPYDLTDRQNEQRWQTIVYVVLKAFGAGVSAEVKTNEGRIDMTAETPEHCYVIEFKLDTSAAAAIRQIKANRYADKFAGNGKTLTLVGLAFSKAKRTIVDAAVEKLEV